MKEIDIRNFFPTYTSPKAAELGQDVLVLAVTGKKQQGYFVEFGAMDGVFASNTVVLEQHYGWRGIVAEPARRFHEALTQNRRCSIDHRAVTGSSGSQLKFKEVPDAPGLSTLVQHINSDGHALRRSQSQGDVYTVDTVSLNDLLTQHSAPRDIDYISIDTEGAEVSVLEAFDWSRHSVGIWTIEHNHQTKARNCVFEIMTQQGYTRVLTDMSRYDDWYVK